MATAPQPPSVVERHEWLDARRALLTEEKALTHQREAVARARRELPWTRIGSEYRFDTEDGERSLAELFGPHNQLVVYHFMFGPGWDEGCPSCSFWADSFDGLGVHLAARDTALVAVSRGPLADLLAYRERMGWSFRWVSSAGSSFNMDFDVSFPPDDDGVSHGSYNFGTIDQVGDEMPGLSVFARDETGDIFHTYSCYSRGLDPFNAAYQLLDLTPKGRDEDDLDWSMAWLRRHDQY